MSSRSDGTTRFTRKTALAGIGALAAFAARTRAGAQSSSGVIVFAGASLTEAFDEVGQAFTRKTGTPVTFHFAGADALATQIKAGAPADVFASANMLQMNVVVAGGFTASLPRVFARNRIVALTPKGDPHAIASIADLAKPGVRVVLEAPTVPDGRYARMAFGMLAGRPGYPSDFAAAVEKNVITNELDIKAVVETVVLGEADAGVAFHTDLTPTVVDKVVAIPFPVQPDVAYPIAPVTGGSNLAGGRAFVDYVLSDDGQAILRKHGFLAP